MVERRRKREATIEQQTPNVRTLAKALGILEAVSSDPGHSVAEIASTVGLNRTTTHRLVQALVAAGYLTPAESGRGFDIGLKILPLAARQLDGNRVRLAALPYLNALAQETGERVNLGIAFDGQVLYLAGVEKPSLPNMYSRFGKLAPAHCCSLGKAIYAYVPDLQDRLLAGAPYESFTPNTIVTRAALNKELRQVRRAGFARDNQEHMPGVWCLAAPIVVNGTAVAAIGVSGSAETSVFSHKDAVMRCAEVISHVIAPDLERRSGARTIRA